MAEIHNSAVPAIGVLDLQGGVAEHLDHLARIGVAAKPVKEVAEIAGLAGLIIPGGESTCLSRLLRIFGITEAIRGEFHRGMKIWGTCAGAILLASAVRGEDPSLALIDMDIERNSFGSQLDSFACEARIPIVSQDPIPLIFIRAPRITRVGRDVTVLLAMDGFVAAVESDGVLATVFHPELTGNLAFHRYFAAKCGVADRGENAAPDTDPSWNLRSWTRRARIACTESSPA